MTMPCIFGAGSNSAGEVHALKLKAKNQTKTRTEIKKILFFIKTSVLFISKYFRTLNLSAIIFLHIK
jgi:hypothetical protein